MNDIRDNQEEIIELSGTFDTPTDGTKATLDLAGKIIFRANDVAITTVARARREVAAQVRAVKSRATRLGQKRAIKAAKSELDEMKRQMSRDFEKLQNNFKNECLELCLSITRDVIADELTSNPSSIKKRIARAIQQLARGAKYKLFLSPDDKKVNEDKIQLKNISDYELDQGVSSGAARLESSTGVALIDPFQHFSRIALEIKNTLTVSELN